MVDEFDEESEALVAQTHEAAKAIIEIMAEKLKVIGLDEDQYLPMLSAFVVGEVLSMYGPEQHQRLLEFSVRTIASFLDVFVQVAHPDPEDDEGSVGHG